MILVGYFVILIQSSPGTHSRSPSESCCGQGKWHHTFTIPEKRTFSGCVQTAIESGVISAKARHEIVQTLRTYILQYTRYPTSEEYTAVCQKLILTYPNIKDTIGSNGYVSWEGGGLSIYFWGKMSVMLGGRGRAVMLNA